MVILLAGVQPLARAADLGLQPLLHRVQEHDATAVRLDPLENQLHDAVEQLVDVQRVAHRQRRAIHHLEIAAARASQEFFGSSAWESKTLLPSCCVTEWMIRDWSSGSAAAAMLTDWTRSSPPSPGGPV